ncbi:hypothetical protein [Sorangium sp. So ce388]
MGELGAVEVFVLSAVGVEAPGRACTSSTPAWRLSSASYGT